MVGGNGRRLPVNGSNRMGKLSLKMVLRNYAFSHVTHTHSAEGRNELKMLPLKSSHAIQKGQNIENRIYTKPSTTDKKLRRKNMLSQFTCFTFHLIRRLIFSFNEIPQKRARHTQNFLYILTHLFV